MRKKKSKVLSAKIGDKLRSESVPNRNLKVMRRKEPGLTGRAGQALQRRARLCEERWWHKRYLIILCWTDGWLARSIANCLSVNLRKCCLHLPRIMVI